MFRLVCLRAMSCKVYSMHVRIYYSPRRHEWRKVYIFLCVFVVSKKVRNSGMFFRGNQLSFY